MTDPTHELDEVVVTGQRRRPGGVFPAGPGGGGGSGDDGGAHQNEVEDPGAQPPEPPPPHPCENPDTAVPWNADAAAAAAIAAFRQAAAALGGADAPGGVPNLGRREFGRGLARGSGGSVSGNAVSWGNPTGPDGVSSMTLDMTGIGALDYIGDVHSHPNGNPLPSQADWDGFMHSNQQARNAGRTQDTFYLYIITVDSSGNPTGIRVYQDGPRSANSPNPDRPTSTGPEVNPDAQPCP